MISSNANGQIKELVKLQRQQRQRKKSGLFVVEGAKLVAEAAEYGKLEKLYLAESVSGREDERISHLLKHYPTELVSDSIFGEISDTVTPQGVLGLAAMPVYETEDLLALPGKRFLLLDDLRDPGNLGTIMRTAEGAGMSAVILSKGSVELFNPKVVRATMGAIFRVPYCYVESLPEIARTLKSQEIPVFGTAMNGDILYDEPDYTEGAAIVIGNEANGISEEMFAEVTEKLCIPMAGKLESLNAAVSAALIMYEMERQCRKKC
ncbi:MAG: RNA methyltransferase [Lachnospiraceae bacterium]|nr:RNA methyltransferase [Lachnospiraceae bacterium]